MMRSAVVESSYPYRRPPITEAVIELRFADPIDRAHLDRISVRLADKYPVQEEIRGVGLEINMVAPTASRVQTSFEGYKRINLEGTRIVIIASSHIASSVLAPYPGWDAFRASALENWRISKTVLKYRRLARVGVRYINRLDIPIGAEQPLLRIEDYIRMFPSYPDSDLPPMRTFTMQLLTYLSAIEGDLITNVANVPSPLVGHASILLDIDIGRQANIPQNDRSLWKFIDSVRLQKNKIFELAITDRSRDLFNK